MLFASLGPLASQNEALKLCSALVQRGEVEQAVRRCKEAVALDPQSAAGHMLLGQAYLAQRAVTMVAEAKAEFQQALDLDPGLFWARFYLAKVYIDLGQYAKAKAELERGLAERPNVAHFLSLLGEVNRKLGHPEASIELNRKALYTKRKRYAEAEEVGKKAIALDPSRSEGYLHLAQLYNVQGLSDKALAALQSALPEGKTFSTSAYYQQLQADIFFERGRAYQAKGMTGQAIQAYSRSLEFDSSREETRRRLAALKHP